MSDTKSAPSVNSWLEEELYQQFQHNHKDVPEGWEPLFETSNGYSTNGHATATAVADPPPAVVEKAEQKAETPATPPAAAVVEATPVVSAPPPPPAPVESAVTTTSKAPAV